MRNLGKREQAPGSRKDGCPVYPEDKEKKKEKESMENTVKIHILGAAAVVVSGVKLEDWKLAEQYAPETLKMKDENGEPAFRVMTDRGTGSINRYGIVWGNYPTEEGFATITILIDQDVENKKEAVMKVAGSALEKLIGIEGAMPGILEGIREKVRKIETNITQE